MGRSSRVGAVEEGRDEGEVGVVDSEDIEELCLCFCCSEEVDSEIREFCFSRLDFASCIVVRIRSMEAIGIPQKSGTK